MLPSLQDLLTALEQQAGRTWSGGVAEVGGSEEGAELLD